MSQFKVEFHRQLQTDNGVLAELFLIEPNGDRHRVRCHCREDHTTENGEFGDGETLDYLSVRYGSRTLWKNCREETLQHCRAE